MAKTKKHYDDLMSAEVEKFSEADVDYRPAEAKEHCGGCVHFLVRNMDGLGLCEVVRPTDEYKGIDPDDVCDFWTKDGKIFPLLP